MRLQARSPLFVRLSVGGPVSCKHKRDFSKIEKGMPAWRLRHDAGKPDRIVRMGDAQGWCYGQGAVIMKRNGFLDDALVENLMGIEIVNNQ